MLAPGAVISPAGRLFATIGAATLPDFFNEGIGYMNNGSVAMDSNVPVSTRFAGGFGYNLAGALFVTTVPSGTDVWVSGLRVSTLGQIIVESADAVSFSNGNGITAAGNLSVN